MSVGQVTTRLFQGSAPPRGEHLPFDLVVLAAEEVIPEYGRSPRPFGQRAKVMRVPLTDGGRPLSPARVRLAFDAAADIARAYANGKKVLVTCAMGWNRSGLLVALALLELGVAAPAAIHAVKRARGPNALGNPFFVELVYAVAGRSMLRIPIERSSCPG